VSNLGNQAKIKVSVWHFSKGPYYGHLRGVRTKQSPLTVALDEVSKVGFEAQHLVLSHAGEFNFYRERFNRVLGKGRFRELKESGVGI
jgi:hypothetical protein